MNDKKATDLEKTKDNAPTDYMGTKEAAKLWGVSQGTVSMWCRTGKFGNAVEQDAKGSPWRIPRNITPPVARH